MPPPAAALMDELVEEFLLRLPPDDPASLVNAALVCKRWGRLIAGPAFRRKFRKIHRTRSTGGGAGAGGGSDGAARSVRPDGSPRRRICVAEQDGRSRALRVRAGLDVLCSVDWLLAALQSASAGKPGTRKLN